MSNVDRVVVIGTGPPGATAAVFLARAGLEPLVLEAGSGKTALGITARVRGVTIAKFKPPLGRRADLTMTGDPAAELFEELAPGGLSNHWACAVPRFSPDDFADAARGGEAFTWPIGYDDLAPFYDRVEPLLRIAGSSREVPALPAGRIRTPWALDRAWDPLVREATAVGRDVVAMPYAYGGETMLDHSATAFNSFTRLAEPLARSGEISIRYDAQALRLVWSPSQRRVTSVIYTNPSTGSTTTIPCRAVVLAAGAVNSAQILLESSSTDFPDGLGNTHGVLGRYLHDHPLAKIVVDLGRPVPEVPASYITRPPLARSAPLYAAAFMQWTAPMARVRRALGGGLASHLGFSVFGTMAPTREDGIALDRSRPSSGRSPLLFSLRHPPAARAVLEEARDELMGILSRAGWEPRLRVFDVEVPGNSVHYGGTCRMHDSPRFGVVDRMSRVHGVRNVVVADSAVFTTGPEKNPVLTAMALAARATANLAEDVRSGDL